jgi:hypothetical protein
MASKKNRVGILVMVFVFGFFTFSCSTLTKWADPNVTWQEQALVLAADGRYGYAEIFGLNNRIGSESIITHKVFVIPAGNQTLRLNGGTPHKTARNMRLTADFAPGGRYVLHADARGSNVVITLMTLDEYRTWFLIEGSTARLERREADFEERIFSHFVAAETRLSK